MEDIAGIAGIPGDGMDCIAAVDFIPFFIPAAPSPVGVAPMAGLCAAIPPSPIGIAPIAGFRASIPPLWATGIAAIDEV